MRQLPWKSEPFRAAAAAMPVTYLKWSYWIVLLASGIFLLGTVTTEWLEITGLALSLVAASLCIQSLGVGILLFAAWKLRGKLPRMEIIFEKYTGRTLAQRHKQRPLRGLKANLANGCALTFVYLVSAGIGASLALYEAQGIWNLKPAAGSGLYEVLTLVTAAFLFSSIRSRTLAPNRFEAWDRRAGVGLAILLGLVSLVTSTLVVAESRIATNLEWGVIVASVAFLTIVSFAEPMLGKASVPPLPEGPMRYIYSWGASHQPVFVAGSPALSANASRKLEHRFSRSTEGFSWGTPNDGAFDLARSILVESLGVRDPSDQYVVEFMKERIVPLPVGLPWVIDLDDVWNWAVRQQR